MRTRISITQSGRFELITSRMRKWLRVCPPDRSYQRHIHRFHLGLLSRSPEPCREGPPVRRIPALSTMASQRHAVSGRRSCGKIPAVERSCSPRELKDALVATRTKSLDTPARFGAWSDTSAACLQVKRRCTIFSSAPTQIGSAIIAVKKGFN